MTEEQFNKAIRINDRIKQLVDVNREIADTTRHRLSYITHGVSDWRPSNEWIMKHISDILDRHDKQIRQEIDEEIKKLKKEIEIL